MLSVTLTTSQKKYDKSLPGFLREHPLPEGMSVGQHIKTWLAGQYYKEAKYGLQKIAGDAIELEEVFE